MKIGNEVNPSIVTSRGIKRTTEEIDHPTAKGAKSPVYRDTQGNPYIMIRGAVFELLPEDGKGMEKVSTEEKKIEKQEESRKAEVKSGISGKSPEIKEHKIILGSSPEPEKPPTKKEEMPVNVPVTKKPPAKPIEIKTKPDVQSIGERMKEAIENNKMKKEQINSGIPPAMKETENEKKVAVIPPATTDIIPGEPTGFLSPACTITQAVEAFNLFESAKTKILKPTDVLYIGRDGRPADAKNGKPHIKRSGWRKLARFFNLSLEIINVKKEPSIEEGHYVVTATAKVTHPCGAVAILDGVVTSKDAFFTKGGRCKADEENVIMKAETVALNRAISDMLGSGECSAEEMKGD